VPPLVRDLVEQNLGHNGEATKGVDGRARTHSLVVVRAHRPASSSPAAAAATATLPHGELEKKQADGFGGGAGRLLL
jgi:hypothetical protein